MYAQRGREGIKEKPYLDAILLFKSVQGGEGCLKITKFERMYFMDCPNSS